jgi:hypothetical protein
MSNTIQKRFSDLVGGGDADTNGVMDTALDDHVWAIETLNQDERPETLDIYEIVKEELMVSHYFQSYDQRLTSYLRSRIGSLIN